MKPAAKAPLFLALVPKHGWRSDPPPEPWVPAPRTPTDIVLPVLPIADTPAGSNGHLLEFQVSPARDPDVVPVAPAPDRDPFGLNLPMTPPEALRPFGVAEPRTPQPGSPPILPVMSPPTPIARSPSPPWHDMPRHDMPPQSPATPLAVQSGVQAPVTPVLQWPASSQPSTMTRHEFSPGESTAGNL